MSLREIISLETVDGDPLLVHGYEVTPQSQAMTVRLPFGGFVWNRPLAVTVSQNGNEERIAIVDATRVAQITIYAFTALLTLVLWRVISRQSTD